MHAASLQAWAHRMLSLHNLYARSDAIECLDWIWSSAETMTSLRTMVRERETVVDCVT